MPRSALLPAKWEVPQRFRDRLGDDVGRQRAMVAEGHLLLVLHALPEPEQDERVGRLFWRSPDGTWRASGGGGGAGTLQGHLDTFRARVDALEQAEDQAGDAEAYFRVISAITPIQRTVRNLHAALQSAREQLPGVPELIRLRDAAYAIERGAELLLADARNSLDFYLARKAEQQSRESARIARAGHRLNIMAAVFLPVATAASVFGMNLQHGWEQAPGPWPFAAVAAAGLVSGVALLLLLRR